VNELRKIMGLDESYKVIKVEERKEGKVITKFTYVETTSKNTDVQNAVNIQKVFMIS